MNEKLRDFRFTRYHFDNIEIVRKFVLELKRHVDAHIDRRIRGLPGFGSDTRILPVWMGGTEKNDAVFLQLTQDPKFSFSGNDWKVTFNMFRIDGSVDQWTLRGEHDPKANTNQITSIDIARLKPAGTFSYPLQAD